MSLENEKPVSDTAVCFDFQNRLCAASYDEQGALVFRHFADGENSHAELSAWRESLGLATNAETVFRFVPNLFMEQTHVAVLNGDVLELADAEITEWLAQAAAKGTAGLDGKPIFETNFSKSAYDYTRLPNNFIGLTELPLEALELTRHTLLPVATPINTEELDRLHYRQIALPEFPQVVETRLRVIARHLAEADRDYFAALAGDETVAFFAFTPEGAGFALWNPAAGFYVELGDCFHHTAADANLPDSTDKTEYLGQLYGESVCNFLNEQFYRRIIPEDEEFPPVKLQRIYWTATANLAVPLELLIREFAAQTEFPFVHVPAPMEEMVVSGLLLGGADKTTALIPGINLANDIARQYESVLDRRQAVADRQRQRSRRLALIYALLPVVSVLGLIAGLLLNNWRIEVFQNRRAEAAQIEKERLKPLIAERTEYEKTRGWYQDVLRQIIGLRRKQTAALGFAARLDPLFPATDAFYVSDLKLVSGGNFELRGLARDQFAVSEFVRQMEFAEDGSGPRFFSALTLEFKQGSSASEKSSSAVAGVVGNLASGISGFLIKGNFAPAAAIQAQETKPAGAPLGLPATPAAPNANLPVPPVKP